MILYKYRSLSNSKRLEFALDIFVNHRMHGAKFTDLNDPMEGKYTRDIDQMNRQFIDDIRRDKMKYRIVSLSEKWNDVLMWIHYADNNAGIVVGVTLPNQNATVEPVDYVDDLTAAINVPDIARGILMKKLKFWGYEKEQRVLFQQTSPEEPFIQVEVRELIFGFRAESHTKELISKIAECFCPEIAIRTIKEHELETGTQGVTGL